MKRFAMLTLVILVVSYFGCSREHRDLPTGFVFDAPPEPANLKVTPGAELATLEWSFPGESFGSLDHFNVYYYYEMFDMMEQIGTTTDTTFIDSFLVGNLYYCYEVSAVNVSGLEGWRTGPVCVFVTSAAP